MGDIMKQYNTNNGILTLTLIPNYEIDNRIVVALVRNIKNPNYDETLITYYDNDSNFQGLSYLKTYNDNTKIIFNIRNDESISYEYQYIAYDEGYFNISGSYEDNGNSQSVIIKQNDEERMFRKYLDEDGDINYLYSDNKNDNANCYHLIIHYNNKTNETTYSLYGSEFYFEYSSLIEDDCIIEDFFDDNNLVLTYDGATVYKGKYDPKEPINPDKELESIINGETEVEEEEIDYEEIELASEYYKDNGHGPIYNKYVSKYTEEVEFYLNGLKSNFPKINRTIYSKDKEYLKYIKEEHPDIDFNRLLLNINNKNFIDSTLNSIKVRKKEK